MLQSLNKFIREQFVKDYINDSFNLCILAEKLAKLVMLIIKFYSEVKINNFKDTKRDSKKHIYNIMLFAAKKEGNVFR